MSVFADQDSLRLNLIESNSLESLADVCAMIMASYPLSDPFIHEKLVVMNLGMKNFVNQRITAQNKISALCDYGQVWQLVFDSFFELNPALSGNFTTFITDEDSFEFGSLEGMESFHINFYDRDHMKWNIYSQICRRPRADLRSLVDSYESNPNVANSEPLQFFSDDGPYKVQEAKRLLIESRELADEDEQLLIDLIERENKAKYGATSKSGAAATSGAAETATSGTETATSETVAAEDDSHKKDLSSMDSWSFINLDNSELFDRIKDYVSHDTTDERAFELAAKLSDTFDQYQIYRPHWILAWNNFSLSDFEAYEKNPDDPQNPINKFIEGQCSRYLNRKSGLLSSNLRKQIRDLASEEGATDAEVEVEAAEGGLLDKIEGLDADSSLNVSEQRKAEAALSELEQEQAILRASVETIRNNFKQNVWQMKLWCLLRPGISLPFESLEQSTVSLNSQKELTWYMSHLDRAQVLSSLIDQLHNQTDIKLSFERVFVFGVSSMPQIIIDFLNALAKHCQVFLLFFNPTPVFWADIRSDHTNSFKDYIQHIQTTRQLHKNYLSRLKRKLVAMPSLLKTLKRDDYDNNGERIEGHPLLLSYGRQCKDMINMLLDVDPPISSVACFSEPLEEGSFTRSTMTSTVREPYTVVRGGTLLKYLQTTIYEMDVAKERYELAPSDRSIVVHSCFTLRREVEALRDHLLRLFNEQRCPYRRAHNECICHKSGLSCEYASPRHRCQRSALLPRDIVVMVPAINTYAPHITAVFGGVDKNSSSYIPFVISDQTETDVNTVAQALLRLLEINSERITSVMVIELLNEPAIGRRFGISTSDVDVISSWLTKNHVYWGLDEAETSEESEITIPGSFSLGLDRMILGSLLGKTEHTPCFSEIEGNDSILLGKFWNFIQALRDLRQHFTPELQQSPEDWEKLLREKLRERFFDDSEETLKSLRCVDNFINRLKEVFSHLKKAPRLTLQVFAAALRQGLTSVRNFTPFYGERVNFCSLIPMRSVPFKHVFILGLNDTDFPRKATTPAFNLIGTKEMFERGDRSPALDDRFLFLEALLSARDSLYLSYIGQSPIDQTDRNPSLVLTELLYYIKDHCQLPLPDDPDERRIMELDLGKAVMERLLIKDRLNAYHIDNYVLTESDRNAVRNTTGSLQAKLESLVAAKVAALDEAEQEKANKANRKILNDSKLSIVQKAQLLGVQPYEMVLDDSNIWRMPSFNRSYINLMEAIHCESPILGGGNFSKLVGLPEQQVVDFSTVLNFCKKPCAMFMQRKLGLSLKLNNKTKLAADEDFSVEMFEKYSILQEMVRLPQGQQLERFEFLSQLGELPYGVFKDMLQEEVIPMYNSILKAIKSVGINSAQEIESRQSATHYDVQLLVPVDAIYGDNPISPREILEKYNTANARSQFVEIGNSSSLNKIDNELQGEDLPEVSVQLAEDERAQPRFKAPDGTLLLQLTVSLQIEARTSPIVVDTYSKIKAKPLDDGQEPDEKWINTAVTSDCNIMLNSVYEAIAQYLYEPVDDIPEDANDKVKITGAFLPTTSSLYIPARTKERLQDIKIIDRDGCKAIFKNFESGAKLENVLQQMIIFYLQASCSPYPAGRNILSCFEIKGETLQKKKFYTYEKNDKVNHNFAYDQDAAYLFKNSTNIERNGLLMARMSNFYFFIKDELLPQYKVLTN